jgi:nitrogen-specific signal transduction histidine kinase/ActR/RegA family two-component response regulator
MNKDNKTETINTDQNDLKNGISLSAGTDNEQEEIQKLKMRLQTAEEQLHRQELFFTQISRIAPIAFLIADDRTEEVLYFSKRFCELWHLEKIEEDLAKGAIGYRELMEICFSLAKNRSKSADSILSVQPKGEGNKEEEMELLDGTVLRVYCRVVREGSKGYLGRLCIFEDITERRRLANELVCSKKSNNIDTLTGNIVKDFKEFLAGVNESLVKIADHQELPHKITDEIVKITGILRNARSLMTQMQVFTERGKPKFERIVMPQIIIELVSLLREILLPGILVETELQSNLPTIWADRNQLHQALLNLCLNAKDAMAGGGKITISASLMKGDSVRSHFEGAGYSRYLRIDIRDTGTGINKESQNRLFEPFYTTKKEDAGAGLGLSIVEGIVKAHQGFIDFESVWGKGSIFRVYLPLRDDLDENSGVDFNEKDPFKRGETILVVEDEKDLLHCLKEFFELEGYRVLTATDGESGIAKYEREKDHVSLVLSDKDLPGSFNGEELLCKIRKIKPGIKCILASGFIERHKQPDEQGSDDLVYLQKPYKMDIITRKVRELLDNYPVLQKPGII